MKLRIIILSFSLFLGFNSCNNALVEDIVKSEKELAPLNENADKQGMLEQILPRDISSPVYVNIINSAYCFSCYPVFSMVAGQLKESGLDADNLVYVFPSMRKVMQADFLDQNFNLHDGEAKVIFDDQLYQYMQEEYQLQGSSNLLCFNSGREMTGRAIYDRANVAEVLSIVN